MVKREQTGRAYPSVAAYSIQCNNCFKWRLIPTKEKYEQLRAQLLAQPFVCQAAREWRVEISCDDQADIERDGSRLWAIDKPNIPQPPPRWERLLRIRGGGGTKFADVYYKAPWGKRFRSTVEIEKYMVEHPHDMEGLNVSQFSFQSPRPWQENYVRKRVASSVSQDGPEDLEPIEAKPLAWKSQEKDADLQPDDHGYSSPSYDEPVSHTQDQPEGMEDTN